MLYDVMTLLRFNLFYSFSEENNTGHRHFLTTNSQSSPPIHNHHHFPTTTSQSSSPLHNHRHHFTIIATTSKSPPLQNHDPHHYSRLPHSRPPPSWMAPLPPSCVTQRCVLPLCMRLQPPSLQHLFQPL